MVPPPLLFNNSYLALPTSANAPSLCIIHSSPLAAFTTLDTLPVVFSSSRTPLSISRFITQNDGHRDQQVCQNLSSGTPYRAVRDLDRVVHHVAKAISCCALTVTCPNSTEEWEAIKAKDSVTVIDFTATWCGPCRFIGPIFEK